MKNEICFSIKEPLTNVSFIYDVQGRRFLFISPALVHLLNFKQDAPLSQLLEHFHKNDRKHILSLWDDFIRGIPFDPKQLRLHSKTGDIWIRLCALLFDTAEGKIITGNVSDITNEVNNLLTEQKYANKKNSILNLLSHDLRGPLSVANNLSKTLEKKTEEATLNKVARGISEILEQSLNLINDLIQREFLETVEVELVLKSIDIATKAAEYMKECRKSAELTQRKFHFSSTDKHIFMNLDESKFMQVLNNLMSNSLKFTKDGGVISLELQNKKDSVVFIFSDNGIGIPKKYHGSLFNKFTDARRQGLNGEPTIGLGLSIVKTIVEWHGGTIRFESEENKGTTFIIEIPRSCRSR